MMYINDLILFGIDMNNKNFDNKNFVIDFDNSLIYQ